MSQSAEAQIVKLLTRSRPPRKLFHYTSPVGLLGILKSRSVWATNIRFLNDRSEFSFALKLAREALQERVAKAKSGFDRALYTVLEERFRVEGTSKVYVSSFSENSDQLSQWRAYCPPAGGYAAGFRSKFLVSLGAKEAPHPDRILTRCVYEQDAHREVIDKVFEAIVQFAEESLHSKVEHDRVFRECFKLFGRLLPLVAPALKDPSFEEEDEWRLICLPSAFESQELRFREGRSTLVPFYEYSLGLRSGSLPIEDLIIGPTPHPALAREATLDLLSSFRLASATVTSSVIPYRSW